jgi:hypothetical protein
MVLTAVILLIVVLPAVILPNVVAPSRSYSKNISKKNSVFKFICFFVYLCDMFLKTVPFIEKYLCRVNYF